MFYDLCFVTVFELILQIIFKVGRAEKLSDGLSVHFFQSIVDWHPINMLVEKYVGLWLTVNGVIHATQGKV